MKVLRIASLTLCSALYLCTASFVYTAEAVNVNADTMHKIKKAMQKDTSSSSSSTFSEAFKKGQTIKQNYPGEPPFGSSKGWNKGVGAGGFPNTPLDDYVYADDGAFAITDLKISYDATGYTIHLYNFTSQKWLTPNDSSRPIWYHILAVIIPDNLNPAAESSLLYITGGANDAGWVPKASDTDIKIASTIATGANTTAAVLFQVPNEGISFPCDPWKRGARSEDSAIALTWWHYTQFPDQPEWVLEMPMAKAGVKALDALQLILPEYIGGRKMGKFIVAGASKRGWTTWLVGAAEANRGPADNRVLAIVPIVLDALHMHSFMHRHYTSLGGWSFALRDYVEANITVELDSANLNQMFTFVDAWFYRERLTMPKYVINAGGDEFQLPDDQRYWGAEMPGSTHFLLIKNAEHSLITGLFELLPTVTSYVVSLQAGTPLPTVQWEISNATGAISVATSVPPTSVQIAFSDSPLGPSAGRRDFRWAALGVEPCISIFGGCLRPVFWGTTKSYINATGPMSFDALMPIVNGQFRVFTVEMRFANPLSKDDLTFTVPASIIPDIYPFPDCYGTDCGTNLV